MFILKIRKLIRQDGEEDWEKEINRKIDEYIREIINEITKQIDEANKKEGNQILDFSTLKIHK